MKNPRSPESPSPASKGAFTRAFLGDFKTLARLGLLVGLFEATAIVRYDWLHDDWQPARVVTALGWGALILLINGAFFGLLGGLVRGRAWAVALLYAAFVGATRWDSQDRFEWSALYPLPLGVLLAGLSGRWRGLAGLAASLLAVAGLWGRVPVYTSPLEERLLFLVPGLLLTTLAGALPAPRARGGVGATAALSLLSVFSILPLSSLGLAGLLPRAARAEGEPPPNILWVLVDTTRRDAIGPHGDAATPSTRRIAAEGAVFSDAITVIPKTTQSVAAFQTARYPIHDGVRQLHDSLPADQTTFAEHLGAQGYRTGAVVHNGWIMRGKGFEQGFQQFWSFFEIERTYGPLRLTGIVSALDRVTVKKIRAFDGNTNSAVSTDVAIDWLDENGDTTDPFYLYVHYFDPHWPYRPPGFDGNIKVNNIKKIKVNKKRVSRGQMIFKNPLADTDNEKAAFLYEKEVDYNTDQVSRLLDWLDEHDKAKDTIVIFTADHGHHLGDHGYWYHHGEFLYEPGIDIPMLVRYPQAIPAGTTFDAQFRSIDLVPTLLELAKLPAMEATDGLPLSKLKADGSPPAFLETDISYFSANKRRYVGGNIGKVRGVRMGKWKLHYTPRKNAPVWELYDLEADAAELNDLVAQGTAPDAVLKPLMAFLADHIPPEERAALEAMGNPFDRIDAGAVPAEAGGTEAAGSELNENERNMLESLGYIEN